jgi:hypothetical protein
MTEQTTDEPEVVEPTGSTADAPSTTVDTEPETFDREYVRKLRDEAAGHRVKAKRTDALNARLATAQAALTGKLADPTDLPFDESLLDDDGLVDEAKVHAAVEDLIKRKPHLAARRPTGNVGQGARPETPEIGLAAMLRAGA